MHIDGTVEGLQWRPPDQVHQPLARHHSAGMACQRQQQVELVAGECALLARHAHLAGPLVDLQIIKHQHRGIVVRPGGATCSGPTLGGRAACRDTCATGNRHAGRLIGCTGGPGTCGRTALSIIPGGGIRCVYGLAVDLPAGAPAGAATSLNEALRVSSDPRVVSAAVDAYDTAFAVVLAAVALVCLVGASVVSRLLRETAPGGADEPGGER